MHYVLIVTTQVQQNTASMKPSVMGLKMKERTEGRRNLATKIPKLIKSSIRKMKQEIEVDQRKVQIIPILLDTLLPKNTLPFSRTHPRSQCNVPIIKLIPHPKAILMRATTESRKMTVQMSCLLRSLAIAVQLPKQMRKLCSGFR